MSASFVVLGASLVLGVYLVATTLLSLVVALAARLAGTAPSAFSPAARARLLFAACVLPTAGGVVAGVGFALPAWLVHEPRGTDEQAAPVLMALAAVAALLLSAAWRRAFAEYRRTARAVAAWTHGGRAVAIADLDVPAVRVDHAFPLAAVAGLWRPRLLLAGAVMDALTADELRAVAAHESGHVVAGDVLKRLVLRACPDPLPGTGIRRRLEQGWERASEAAADDFAACRVPRLHLASALVKIASLVPRGTGLAVELPAFATGAPVAARVYDLLALDRTAPSHAARTSGRTPYAALGAAAVGAAWLALLPQALPATHRLLEAVVSALS